MTTKFHMVDGYVRNFNGHISRLVDANPHAVAYEEKIRKQLRAETSNVHAWVNVEDHSFTVELRASFPSRPNIILDTHGHLDERSQPTIRGRDFAWQTRASAASRRQGADEGLLIDEQGKAISAVDASLLALRGDMVFHSTHPRTIPSVLQAPILNYLEKCGATPKARPDGFNINELRTAEVWLLDSISGVRRVAGWLEYGNIFPVAEARPVAAFMPTYSEVNDYLWTVADKV